MKYKIEELTYAQGEFSNMAILRKIVEKLSNAGWQVKLGEYWKTSDEVKEGFVIIENIKTGEQRHYDYWMYSDGEFRCKLADVKRAEVVEYFDRWIKKGDETVDGLAYQLPAWE